MKRLFSLAIALLFTIGCAFAQQPVQQQHPHQQHHGCQHHCAQNGQHCSTTQRNSDGIEMLIAKAFPTVKSIKQENKWTAVYDAGSNLLGYLVYSKPASDGIKGYNGETPVMISFDVKKKITSVYLLQNTETPSYARRVQEAGLYNQWNGLSIKKARKKKVDTVSGATFTSRAVIQSVQAVLATL